MDSIKINDITIDLLPGPIGIIHSGGADSAILLYILMKYYSDPIHVFTCASTEKFRIAPKIAGDVISKCIDLTNKMNVFHHVYYVDKQNIKNLYDYPRYFQLRNEIKYIYSGTTALPPLDVCDTFINGRTLMKERDPTVTRPVYNGFDKKTYVPFFNHNKKDIKALYETLGVLDSLFPITRSCESLELKSGHCGKCWWCEERNWAFGKC